MWEVTTRMGMGSYGRLALALTLLGCAEDATTTLGNTGAIVGSGGAVAPTTGGVATTGGVGVTGGSVIPTTGGAVAMTGGATGGDPTGTGGSIGTGGKPDMVGGYINLAAPIGEPLDPMNGSPVTPEPPAGWTWYAIEGTYCRDGSQNGMYVRHSASSDKLLIYFEGGGACTTKGFCHFNPANVDEVLTGDGQTVIGTALAVAPGRQQPGVYNFGMLAGIFDEENAENPFKDWNKVYIPYCTGDVHFGSKENGSVPNVPEKQKFVGYKNNLKFMSRIVPTFKDKVDHVVVTGASAGSFGALLNFSMISDSFAGTQVDVIADSGAPFDDAYWPACMQQSWRNMWGLNDSLPPDCDECFQADGGGFLKLADFLIDKHPLGNVAAISSLHDEVIRLFFAPGQNNCAIIETADPFEITVSQIAGGTIFPAADYEAGLLGLRNTYASTGRLSTYYFGGSIDTMHQHTFRPRYYEPIVGGKSMAQFVKEFLAGNMSQVGP